MTADFDRVSLTDVSRHFGRRRALATWITDPRNPLTPRVIVNRLWQWHFGTGLVDTPSDFGLRADPPSHPALLDLLAAGFIADGWSTRRLHRRIVLTAAYRQGSAGDGASAARALDIDPDGRLLWRQRPRRQQARRQTGSLPSGAWLSQRARMRGRRSTAG